MDVRATPVSPPEPGDRSVDRWAVVGIGEIYAAEGDVEELLAATGDGSGRSTTSMTWGRRSG
jgi:hypothetical protein